MKRRSLFLGVVMCLTVPAAMAQNDILRDEFEAMPELQRRLVQLELRIMDLYSGQLDTRFGPMTRRALLQAAVLVEQRTNGEMTFDLENPDEVRQFLSKMSQEQFMFIYDDGYEG